MSSSPFVLADDPRHTLLEELSALQKSRAAIDAREQVIIAELATLSPMGVDHAAYCAREWVREEIACALSLAPRTAASRVHDAVTLVGQFPNTLAAVASGVITLLHARSLLEGTRQVSDTVASAVETRVLARGEGKTVGQFRQHVKRAVLSLDPRSAETKEVDAVALRRVEFATRDDHTVEMYAPYLPAEAAAALDATLRRVAEGYGPEDVRTMDQRRADALLDLAHGAVGGVRRGPEVQVVVAASTLLGLDDQPGEILGQGPVPAAVARRMADDPAGTWRRLLTDPAGQVIDYGRTRYRPPTALAELVRDRTCRFPGCRRPAVHCEIDHSDDWYHGGTTNATNLHLLCARHHHLKHEAGWQVRLDPDGTTVWTSPAGRQYRRPPDDQPAITPPTPHPAHQTPRLPHETWLRIHPTPRRDHRARPD